MRRISTLATIGVLLLAFAQILPAAEPPSGFRNFKWGARPTGKIKKTASNADGTRMYIPSPGAKLAPLYGVAVAEEAYMFSNGKFYSGSAWLKGNDNLEKIKSNLTKEFGKPSFANESMNIWKWKWPGTQIEIHVSHQPKFSRTTVTFLNNAI